MPFDGSTLRALVYELNENLTGAKIEKIYQISDLQIIINIRNRRDKYKLLLSAESSNPRVHLTNIEFENPKNPPTFCMLLRKHLEGFKILRFSQYKMDRILRIDVLGKNELADDEEKSLFIEIMGKHSNIILTRSSDLRIYDSIKRITKNISSVREVLPGLNYSISEISTRLNPLDDNSFEIGIKNFVPAKSLKNNFISTYMGLSPLSISEISYRAGLDVNRAFSSIDNVELNKLETAYYSYIDELRYDKFSPIIINDGENYIDYSAIDLKMYPNSEKIEISNISSAMDEYYQKKATTQIINDKSQSLRKNVANLVEREKKKLAKQENELLKAKDRDKYKIKADLLSANLYRISADDKYIDVEDFYNDMSTVRIELDDRYTPQQYTNNLYKKYSKLKSAEENLSIEIENTKSSINYLENVLYNIESVENTADLDAIREELMETGFIKKQTNKKKSSPSKFMEYITSRGHQVLVGKNNKQNDLLTLKLANRDDLWFHVKDAPGSHVILKYNGDEFEESEIVEAASIAAYNSSIRNSDNITVDYTLRKNVKRHPSKKPGLVNYVNYQSIIIKLSETKLIERIN